MFRHRHGQRIYKSTKMDGLMPLVKMRDGQTGRITEILGGQNMQERLKAMGIRQGQTVRKIGGMFLRGPITIQVEKTQVAIGFGAAAKILIKTDV
jgi:ferrous iron transport protein A